MVSVMPMQKPAIRRFSVTPMWRQAADAIEAAVRSGELAPGEKLPAMRDVADEWEVGYSVMQQARDHLKAKGILASAPGKGTFVAEELPPPE